MRLFGSLFKKNRSRSKSCNISNNGSVQSNNSSVQSDTGSDLQDAPNSPKEDSTDKQMTGSSEKQEWSLQESVLKRMVEGLLDLADLKSSDSQIPAPRYARFDIQDTENEGFLWLEPRTIDQREGLLLKIMVKRKDSDYVHSHFLKKGTIAEVKAYLMQDEHLKEINNSLRELSDSASRGLD